MHEASAKGDLESVSSLLLSGAEFDAQDGKGYTALQVAVQRNKLPVVKALLSHGATTESKSLFLAKPPLHLAAIAGNVDIARLLLDNGAAVDDVDTSNATALSLASKRGSEELVTLLLATEPMYRRLM